MLTYLKQHARVKYYKFTFPSHAADVDGWISGKEFGVQHHEAIEKLEGLGLFQIHTLT
jgi:hypothetical protein